MHYTWVPPGDICRPAHLSSHLEPTPGPTSLFLTMVVTFSYFLCAHFCFYLWFVCYCSFYLYVCVCARVKLCRTRLLFPDPVMWFNVRDPSIPSASVTPSLKWERFPLCGVTSWLLGLNVLSVVMLIYLDPGRPRSPSRFTFPASLPSPHPHLPNCSCGGCKHLTEQGWQIIFNCWTCNKSLRELRGLCMGSNVPTLLCVKF